MQNIDDGYFTGTIDFNFNTGKLVVLTLLNDRNKTMAVTRNKPRAARLILNQKFKELKFKLYIEEEDLEYINLFYKNNGIRYCDSYKIRHSKEDNEAVIYTVTHDGKLTARKAVTK